MKDNPQGIAAWLVQQHGSENARMEVLAGIMQAHEQEDNYALSVWREVKQILEHVESADQPAPEDAGTMPDAAACAGWPNRAGVPHREQSPAASDRPVDGRPE